MSASALSARSVVEAQTAHKASLAFVYRVVIIMMNRLHPYPYTLTDLGLAIQLLQIVGFALNPLYSYDFMFMREISDFVFYLSGPFFLRSYGPLSYVVYFLILAFGVIVMMVGAGLFIVNCADPGWHERTFLLRVCRAILDSMSGWLLIPMLHLCIGGLPCSNGYLRNFPSTKCGDPLHVVVYLVSILGIFLSISLSAFGCLFFNPEPHSHHLLGRAHGYFDFLMLATITFSVVFFHILLGAGHVSAFTVLFFVVLVIWIVSIMMLLPYHNLAVTCLYTGTFVMTFAVTVVNCLTGFEVTFLTSSSPILNCTIVFSIFPLAFTIGYLLGGFRVDQNFKSRLHKLHMHGYTPEHVAYFPYPRTYKAKSKVIAPAPMLQVMSDLQYDIRNEEKEFHFVTEYEAVEKRRLEFFIPYISNALISTDSEVATRFLREMWLKTGGNKKYSSSQLFYTLTMYFKALGYFKQSAYVYVSLGWFLRSYCGRQAAALELLTYFNTRRNFSMDYIIGVKCYRLEHLVKANLGYRGKVYTLALQRAHMFHRHSLETTVKLWDALKRGEPVHQLLMISDDVAKMRRVALQQYHLALATNKDDRVALTYLASFYDELLHEPEISAGIRKAINEIEIDKKNSALVDSRFGNADEMEEVDLHALEKAVEKSQNIRLLRHGNERLFFFLFLFYSLGAAVLFAICMLVVFIISNSYVHKRTKAIYDVLMVKASGFRAVYSTESIALYSIDYCSGSDTSCVFSVEYVELLQAIAESEQDMRVHENLATFGKDSIGYSSDAFNFAAKGYLPLRFYTVGTTAFQGLFSSNDRSSVSLYAKLSSILSSVSTPQVQWLTAPVASSYLTSLFNSIQKSKAHAHSMQFVTDGGLEVYLEASDPFTKAINNDISNASALAFALFSVFFVLLVVHLAMIFIAQHFVTAWTIKNQIMLLIFIHNVPPSVMEDIRAVQEENATSFRVCTALDEEEEDDDDEMGDGEGEDGRKENISALRSALFTVLHGKPSKSCVKQAGNAHGLKRTVRFCLTQYDLTERPRRILREPAFKVDGEADKIVKDFEKSLEEIEEEVRKERQVEQQNRDSHTEHLVTVGYRYQWRKIKERIAAWRNKDELPLYIGITLASLIVVCLGATILVLLLFVSTRNNSSDDKKNCIVELQMLSSFISGVNAADVETSVFCNFFDQDYLDKFSQYIFVEEDYTALSTMLQSYYSDGILKLVPYSEALYNAILRLLLSDIIYVALAARAGEGLGEFSLSSAPYISAFAWGSQEDNYLWLSQTYPEAFSDPSGYVIPELDSLSDTASDFYAAVLPLHRRDRFDEDYAEVLTQVQRSDATIKETTLHSVVEKNDTARKELIICIVFCVVLIIGTAVGFVVMTITDYGLIPRVYLMVALLMSIACLVFTCIDYNIQNDGAEFIAKVHVIFNDVSDFRLAIYDRLVQTESFFHSSQITNLNAIQQHIPSHNIGYLSPVIAQFPSLSGLISNLEALDTMYWQIQSVGLFLYYASKTKAADPTASVSDLYPPSPPFNSTYNYKTETNYETDVSKYTTDHPTLMYSTPDVDLLNTADDLFDMARFAVFGLRGASYYFEIFDGITELINSIASESTNKLNSNNTKLKVITILAIITCILAEAAIIAAVLVPVVRTLRSIVEGPHAEVVKEGMKVAGTNLIQMITVGAIFLISVVIFYALGMVAFGGFKQLGRVAAHSGARLASVERSIAKALYVNHSFEADSACLGLSALHTLQDDIDKLTASREYLYFTSGVGRSVFGEVTRFSSQQRSLLFSTSDKVDTIDTLYRNWIAVLNNYRSLIPEMEVSTASATTTMKDLYVLSSTQKALSATWMTYLNGNYSRLTAALEESDELYQKKINDVKTQTMVPVIVFFCILVITLLYYGIIVIPGLLRRQRESEEDFRPIIATIPKPVMETIPALSFYSDSGIIDESNTSVKDCFGPSPQATQFIKHWKLLDEIQMEQAYPQLETLPHAAVLTTENGVILSTNADMLTMFKHDSLSGKNINVLMDNSAAEVHKRFIEYYIKNRKSKERVGRKTSIFEAMAFTKKMESTHVVVVLMEAPIRNTLYFLAEIHPYSKNRVHK